MRGLLMICAVSIFGLNSPFASGADDLKYMDFHPSVEPGGNRLVYYSYRADRLPDIFILNRATGKEVNITKSPELWEIEPEWGPNGTHIAYGQGGSMGSLEIIVQDVATGTAVNYGPGNGASWSPDSRFIAFSRSSETLHILEVATGDIQDVDLRMLEGKFNSEPAWLPDGSGLVFSNQIKNGGNSNIFKVDFETKKASPLVSTPLHTSSVFVSVDGETLYFNAEYIGGEVDLPDNVAASGSHIYALSMKDAIGDVPLERFMPVTSGLEGQQYFAELSADGTMLFVEAGLWSSSQFQIYSLPVGRSGEASKISGPKPNH